MLDKTEFYINGSWVPSIDGRKFPVFNPATEDAFATIMLGGEKDAQAAIEAAKNAFLEGRKQLLKTAQHICKSCWMFIFPAMMKWDM